MDPEERTHRKIERTAEDRARLAELRDRFRRERPGLDELAAGGEYAPPVPLGEYLDVHRAIAALKAARERAGLSQSDVAERSGIDKAAISRLEGGRNPNPTVGTLARYAAALGKRITIGVGDRADRR